MLQQIWTATLLGMRTLPDRKGAALVIVISMACAVGALLSIGSLSAGTTQFVHANGRPDRVIVLSRNAVSENASAIPRASATIIADAPGVKHDAEGRTILSAENTALIAVPKKSDGLEVFVPLRGIGPQALMLRPEIKLISGRMFQPGRYEAIVGALAAAEFQGLQKGAHVSLLDGEWTIVGVFASQGSGKDSQLLTDADTLLSSMRANTYKSITVMLNSPAAYTAFKSALTTNPTLSVDVDRETAYNERQTRSFAVLVDALAGTVGAIMGLGALFGVFNTMYAAVAARATEIATLRAIGFGGVSVAISVLCEALLLAGIGSLIGASVAWVAFSGNLHAIGGTVITLSVTPKMIASGLILACLLALIGALFPALRIARRPITDALRAN
jgi:putative ABC transport system permease protein